MNKFQAQSILRSAIVHQTFMPEVQNMQPLIQKQLLSFSLIDELNQSIVPNDVKKFMILSNLDGIHILNFNLSLCSVGISNIDSIQICVNDTIIYTDFSKFTLQDSNIEVCNSINLLSFKSDIIYDFYIMIDYSGQLNIDSTTTITASKI